MIGLPPEVGREGIFKCIGYWRFCGRDMMFVAVSANELEQLLELWHFNDAVAAERVELVLREASLAQVCGYVASQVIGAHAAVGEGSRADPAHDRAVSVFLSNRAGDDLLVIHLLLSEKRFGQIGAVK